MKNLFKVFLNTLIAIIISLPLQHVLAQNLNKGQNLSDTVSLASELKPYYDIGDLPAYRTQTVAGQISSYDTTGGNDDGFSGKYSYLRKLPDSSLIIFDVQGPGVINRIWTPTPSEDSLDFYIDDTTHVAFTIKYKDLFSGKIFPFVAPLCNNQLGGYYCYLPVPFQKRCIIVYRGKQTQFHQIGYRLFPKETIVKKFNTELTAEEKSALQQIQNLWNKKNRTVNNFQSKNTNQLQISNTHFQLKPGEKSTILQTSTGGRIVGIELSPSSAFEGLLKEADIKITWDNETHPAVYCPVADFFGYAFGKASMESLLIGTSANKSYCYFPMPFDKSAKIELIYRKPVSAKVLDPLTITANIFYTNEARNIGKEGKFYANWNNQPNVPLHQPHEFLKVSGKGHYVGTVLQARGLQPGMTLFFEGDDSTIVDGKLSMHGTGSEDYFNGGWYAMMDRWDGPFSMPLSGALDYSLPLSRTGGYRLFLTDKISFKNNFYQSIEHGPEQNNKPASYTSVAYYYSNTPTAATIFPKSEETRVSIPDTLMMYPQLMSFNSTGDVGIQQRGESFIFTTPGESTIRVLLHDIPDGKYKILFDYAKLPEGSSFSLWQRQTPLTGWIDSYAAAIENVEHQYISDISLTPLNHTLTIKFKANDNKKQFSLHRIILINQKGN